jgi:mono/diheme cytochrome c family protein
MRHTVSLQGSIAVVLLAGAILAVTAHAGDPKSSKASSERVARGAYLVNLGGCNDCHSPKLVTPKGVTLDPMKILSGHQADRKLPEVPKGLLTERGWIAATNGDLTAWAGPWGISYAANLTPDPATGIGGWTEEMFMKTLKTGKHLGTGRQILPPMPWENFARLNDQDLKDMYAYFMSIRPVRNPVPQPVPPAQSAH